MPLQLDDLAALDAPIIERLATSNGQPLPLLVADIDEDPDQPRREFDANALQIDDIYRSTYIALARAAGPIPLAPSRPRHLDPAPLSEYIKAMLNSTQCDVRKAFSLVC